MGSFHQLVLFKIFKTHNVSRNLATGKVLDVFVLHVNYVCELSTIEQFLLDPDGYVMVKYSILHHIVTNNLRYYRSPVKK